MEDNLVSLIGVQSGREADHCVIADRFPTENQVAVIAPFFDGSGINWNTNGNPAAFLSFLLHAFNRFDPFVIGERTIAFRSRHHV